MCAVHAVEYVSMSYTRLCEQEINGDLTLRQLSFQQKNAIVQEFSNKEGDREMTDEDALAKLESIKQDMFKAEELREEIVTWDDQSRDCHEQVALRVFRVLISSYEASYWWCACTMFCCCIRMMA